MALTFRISNAAAQALLTALGAQLDAGTAAVFRILSGSAPTNVEDAETGTLLATLTCSATAFSGLSDLNPGARATFAAITADSSADNTGTAGYFRALTQTGGTAVAQGGVSTSGADMNFNTVAFTAGSTISLSAATIDMPEG